MKAAPSWNLTEPPPKDGRSILLLGAIFFQDKFGADKEPLLCVAHFDVECGCWHDEKGMSMRWYYGAELQCYAWSDIPDTGDSPIMILEESEKG